MGLHFKGNFMKFDFKEYKKSIDNNTYLSDLIKRRHDHRWDFADGIQCKNCGIYHGYVPRLVIEYSTIDGKHKWDYDPGCFPTKNIK